MSFLEVENLKTSYFTRSGEVQAVNGVSFNVLPGEAIGLAGESGCGKTTTGFSIMRLIPEPGRITEGRIVCGGRDLVQLSEKEMQSTRWKEISMVFQSAMNALNPVTKVGDQIMDAIQLHLKVPRTEARERAEKLLEAVGLRKERLSQHPFEFSGGMRQRAVIALALSCEPKLVIADEPVTALDVTIQAQILELIKKLRTSLNMSMILISHDMSVISDICDKVAVMYAGRIVEFGTAESIFNGPIHPYTKGLLEAIPSMKRGKSKTLFSIPGKPPELVGPLTGCSFQSRCPYVKSVCKKESPERELMNGTWVECHFAKEVMNISGKELYEVPKSGLKRLGRTGDNCVEISHLRKLFPVGKGFLRSLLSRKEDFVRAVDDISFNIRKGEIFGLVGESGCGKTTTARCLVKPYEITEGRIVLDGTDLTHIDRKGFRKYRRNIQMIFQDPYSSLDPRQNVYSAIAEPLRVHKITRNREEETKKITELLWALKLIPPEDYMYKFPHQLSGGERQRVVIARVMALNPKIMIADEPVSMLDVSIRAGILDSLLSVRDNFNVAILLITHDLAVASYMTDRIGVMYLGEIVEIGQTEEVVRTPLHPYTQALIGAVPSFDFPKQAKRVVLKGEPPNPISPPPGCRFNPRCDKAKSVCKEKPALVEYTKDHFCACHLYDQELNRWQDQH